MPFLDTGELFEIGGITIRIGINALALLMIIVTAFSIWGIVGALRARNLLAVLMSIGATLTFGFFTVATILTYGYPELGA
ncbi:DUF2759 domain-containing protein [Lacicoccus qingdaonensis]|uniref:DUF2759 domain-containing protein n=1 Tax=Lacicoccus qingdaonensis TaxID=576118 RepID=A0A1G9EY17_9BACL|nr:DUF2759 domain-containing protein [Salinicoccus qingdaonensis]SDK81002.1 Protein of unknown function [Salinicoccus qingdaonensis]